jgi:hypothetical protein
LDYGLFLVLWDWVVGVLILVWIDFEIFFDCFKIFFYKGIFGIWQNSLTFQIDDIAEFLFASIQIFFPHFQVLSPVYQVFFEFVVSRFDPSEFSESSVSAVVDIPASATLLVPDASDDLLADEAFDLSLSSPCVPSLALRVEENVPETLVFLVVDFLLDAGGALAAVEAFVAFWAGFFVFDGVAA